MLTSYMMGRKIRNTYKCVAFIQTRFKNRMVIRDAKCEMLINYWNKLLAAFVMRNV